MFLYVLNISRWLRPSVHKADLPWSGSLVCTPLPPAGWSSSPSECSGLLHTHTHTEEKKTTSGHHSRSTWHTRHQRSWFSQQARAFVGDDDVSENESLWNHTAADWGTSPSAAGVILQLDVYMEQIAIQVPIKNKVLTQKLLPFIFRHRAPSFLTWHLRQ